MARFQFAGPNLCALKFGASSQVEMAEEIHENIARVEERIAAACRRSGRRREEVRLVAISKTHPAASVRVAFAAGLREFGESRVQEAMAKRSELLDLSVTWHLVGHLQSNKARAARDTFQWVHSLDSLRLAEKLAQSTSPTESRLPVLIEVNLGGEASKAGVRSGEVAALAEQVAKLEALELRGLMVIPPFCENPGDARPYFRQLRAFACDLQARGLPNVCLRELSMGMSHDFEVAIEEGSTIVRVGTAIFGERA